MYSTFMLLKSIHASNQANGMNSPGKLKMARQDSDVMTVVNLVSTDTIELPHELDDFNHPEEKWRKQTRSDSENERSHGAIVVCLGLLCVLLLVAVTVLCIKLTKENPFQSEKEADYWLNLSKNLTEEREKLKKDLAKLHDQCFENPKWITHNLSSYYISSKWKNWIDSRQDCEQRGAQLITINNREEQEFVTMVTSANIVWIGLNKTFEEGIWKWVDGSNITFQIWNFNEPNNRVGNEDCVVSHFNWADYPCDHTFVWICEKDLDF